MPATSPFDAALVGPSTAAPASTGGLPLVEPARLATWCCMQLGKVDPSPTMNDTPQGLAPRMLSSHPCACAANVDVPVMASYSLAITDSPAPWDTVSDELHGYPKANGYLFPTAMAPSIWECSWFTRVAGVTARPVAPVAVMSRANS